MINLLPENEKIGIEKERRARFFALVVSMTFGLSFIMLVFLAPSLLINMTREKISLQKVEELKKSESFLIEQDINNKIKEINTKLSFFGNSQQVLLVSKNAILPLISQIRPGVRIITVISDLKDAKSGSVTIQGFASNREALLGFVDALKKVEGFSNVSLPVSDFVKGKDLNFNVTLTVSI